MLTIFTTPRAFRGEYKIIQENAINSWINIGSGVEIILFGNEYGIDKIANKYHIRHTPKIKRNVYGTPLVDSLFYEAGVEARGDILLYINSDIILPPDFMEIVKVIQRKFNRFLVIGERIDFEVDEAIDFGDKRKSSGLFRRARRLGNFHGRTGIDFFLYSKGLWKKIPPLAIGRFSWDNWLVYEGFKQSGNLIDVSYIVRVIHQNHSTHTKLTGKKRERFEKERRLNANLTGNKQYDLFDSNYFMINLFNSKLILPTTRFGRFIRRTKQNFKHLFNVRLRSYLSVFF